MPKDRKKQIGEEIAALARLKDTDIDTSDVPEVKDWSKAVVGRFFSSKQMSIFHLKDLRSTLVDEQRPESAVNVAGHQKVSTVGHVDCATLTNSELVKVCAEGRTAEAWEEFIRRCNRFITGVVLRVARQWGNTSPEMIEDLVQEVYLKLAAEDCRALKHFSPRDENSLFGFLKVVVSNITHDYFGASYSDLGAAGDMATVELNATMQESHASPEEREIFLNEVNQILTGKASEKDRAIFWLYYQHGLTAEEIADIHGIELTAKGVESVLHRLTKWLKEGLTKEHYGLILLIVFFKCFLAAASS